MYGARRIRLTQEHRRHTTESSSRRRASQACAIGSGISFRSVQPPLSHTMPALSKTEDKVWPSAHTSSYLEQKQIARTGATMCPYRQENRRPSLCIVSSTCQQQRHLVRPLRPKRENDFSTFESQLRTTLIDVDWRSSAGLK